MSVVALKHKTPALRSTVTAHEGTTTGATVNQKLRGGMHPFGWPENEGSTAARTQAGGVVNGQRTDKLMTATPSKVGGTDATHPTLGHSGLLAYDWQVVNRALADIAAQGAEPYFSLDGCPQLLGGSVPPYSGADLTSRLPAYSGYGPEIPNNLASFATMCVDLIHHVTVTQGVTVPYWGLWNEPDGSTEFWKDPDTGLIGTPAQWFEMYAEVANAIKAFDPTLKVGGPEVVNPTVNYTAWINAFLTYCDTNSVPLDFISVHDYAARGWDLQTLHAKLTRTKTALGWTDPLEVIVGEWNSNPGLNPPFTPAEGLTINDQAASYVALELMEMQRLGVARAYFLKPECELGDSFFTGLYSSAGPWATGNVFEMWARIGAASVVTHELAADPGIHVMAAKRAGTLYVLLASHHYRRGPTYNVTVSLPETANDRATSLRVIDQDRSNQFDSASIELETVPVEDVAGHQVRVQMAARSVALLEIAP